MKNNNTTELTKKFNEKVKLQIEIQPVASKITSWRITGE
jgi:hypothetical protein